MLLQLSNQLPFSLLDEASLGEWFGGSKLLTLSAGQTLISPAISRSHLSCCQWSVRLLIESDGDTVTLDRRGQANSCWVSLLRGSPTEWVTASENV